jgi:hypothetical protein
MYCTQYTVLIEVAEGFSASDVQYRYKIIAKGRYGRFLRRNKIKNLLTVFTHL